MASWSTLGSVALPSKEALESAPVSSVGRIRGKVGAEYTSLTELLSWMSKVDEGSLEALGATRGIYRHFEAW